MKNKTNIKNLQFKELMGYKLLDEALPSLLENTDCIIVNTINPHSWVCANKDFKFKQALNNSDLIIADGIGIMLASVILNRKKIHRITGADLWLSLMKELNSKNGRCFYLGSTQEVLTRIEKKIHRDFKSVTFGGYSPPFCDDFSPDHIDNMVDAINDFKPDVLFIGITAPRQEKLAQQLKDRTNPTVTACIGAVFDFVAGSHPRAPSLLCKLGLEWLYRLCREPRRMWRRNLISAPRFFFAVLNSLFFVRD